MSYKKILIVCLLIIGCSNYCYSMNRSGNYAPTFFEANKPLVFITSCACGTVLLICIINSFFPPLKHSDSPANLSNAQSNSRPDKQLQQLYSAVYKEDKENLNQLIRVALNNEPLIKFVPACKIFDIQPLIFKDERFIENLQSYLTFCKNNSQKSFNVIIMTTATIKGNEWCYIERRIKNNPTTIFLIDNYTKEILGHNNIPTITYYMDVKDHQKYS